jgi:bacterial/archaeal transporter family protein
LTSVSGTFLSAHLHRERVVEKLSSALTAILRQCHRLTQFALINWSQIRRIPGMNWFLWALLSAFFAAVTAILSKLGVEGVNSNLATAVRTFFVFGITSPVASTTTRATALSDLSKTTWLYLFLSALATAASWLCYFQAMQLGEVSRVAAIDKLSVAFTLLLAILFLGERVTWQHLTGGTLIILGAIVLSWK